jgi:hypothetical protein
MTQRISRWWALLLAAFLSLVSPVVNAITRIFHPYTTKETTSAGAEEAVAAATLAFTVLPPPAGPPAAPFAGPLEVFINGLLVEDSLRGLVQSTAVATAAFRAGYGYTPEDYLRVTFAAPGPSSTIVAGIAVTDQGEVHVVDATAGLPGGVVYVGGFPVTNTGQLCVVLT